MCDALFDSRMLGLHLAENAGHPLFVGGALHDGFDTLEHIDVGGATNLDTTEPGALKVSPALALITGGTPFGDFTSGGGNSAAFNGNTNQSNTTAAVKGTTAAGYNNLLGKTLGSLKSIGRLKVYGANNVALLGAGGASTVKLQGLNASSVWVDLYTSGSVGAAAGWSIDISQASIIQTPVSSIRLNVYGNGVNGSAIAQIRVYEVVSTGDLTVSTESIHASAQPDWIRAAIRVEDTESAVLNSDILVDGSRDSTWEPAALVEAYREPNSVRVLDTGLIDIAGQGASSDIKLRFRTANGKRPKFLGMVVWAGVGEDIIPLEPAVLERDIYVIAGQSNADGRGVVGEVPSFPYGYKVKVYKHSGVWADGAEPIGDETGAQYAVMVSDSEGTPGASFGMAFGNALYQLRPGRQIGLVPCARGGSSLADWARDLSTSTLYGAMLARLTAAISSGTLQGIIFYQGETDAASSGTAAGWAANFLTIYDWLCSDLSIADLKCIVVELGPDTEGAYPYWTTVQSQQRSLDGARDGNIAVVSASDLTTKVGDEVHLTTASLVTLGANRLAPAMAGLLT